jgi:hypothetical protein
MAYSKKDILDAKQTVRTGVRTATTEMSAASPDPQIIDLGDVCAKVTFQSDGNLAGTIEFSVDGKTFQNSAALATAMTSYSTHNVCAVKVTRSSGTGKVSIAGK